MTDLARIVRQPVVDRHGRTAGWHLVADAPPARHADPDAATRALFTDATSEFGLAALVDDRRAWMPMSTGLLAEPPPMVPEQLVPVVVAGTEATPTVLDALATWNERGFTVAVELTPDSDPRLVAHADICTVDVSRRSDATLAGLREAVPDADLLARSVGDHPTLARCQAAGFTWFEGPFLGQPDPRSTRRLGPDGPAALELLATAQRTDLDPDELAGAFRRAPHTTVKMLRFLGSASFGLTRRVDSIDHAVRLLGLDTLRRWLLVLLASELGDPASPQSEAALVRARFVERIAERLGLGDPDAAFLTGMLSMLPALLGRPAEATFEGLPLAAPVRSALLGHEGPLGQALREALAYERADWTALSTPLAEGTELANHYLLAVKWAAEALAAEASTAA